MKTSTSSGLVPSLHEKCAGKPDGHEHAIQVQSYTVTFCVAPDYMTSVLVLWKPCCIVLLHEASQEAAYIATCSILHLHDNCPAIETVGRNLFREAHGLGYPFSEQLTTVDGILQGMWREGIHSPPVGVPYLVYR